MLPPSASVELPDRAGATGQGQVHQQLHEPVGYKHLILSTTIKCHYIIIMAYISNLIKCYNQLVQL